DHRRPCRVPRRVQRAPATALERELTARTCLVTGAGRGIGAAVAGALAADGHRVGLLGRDVDSLAQLASGLPGESLVLGADVTDPAAVERAFERIERQWGPVEVLVSNAGSGLAARLPDTTDE